MRHLIKEYGYLAVMCVCLVCSAVLLLSVTTDRPLVAIAQEHIPVLRTQDQGEHLTEAPAVEETLSGAPGGFVLTEEELEGKLADFLPDTFPAADIDAELENGLLELSFSMDRSALKDYLKGQGTEPNRICFCRCCPESWLPRGILHCLPTKTACICSR